MYFDYDTFADKGFIAIDSFISTETVRGISEEIETIKRTGQLKNAGIGKQDNFQVNSTERGDSIHWIDPNESGTHTKEFLNKIDELILELNRNFYLGIRDFECHHTEYPAGTFYKKHVDRHKSGSSRIVSAVLYLNEDWKKEDGGQLIIYHENGAADEILPQAGRLAIFLSEKEHEVKVTHRPRKSITGWMLNEKII